jgi:spermidine/putrescine transport system permease protein
VFSAGKSQSGWQGFSWRWYFSDPVNSVLHDPQLHAAVIQTLRLSVFTTVIAVPLGVTFALGINRRRGFTSSTFNFVMILSFVIPELIFGIAMFFTFTVLFTKVGLGTLAETLGLVTWNVSWRPSSSRPGSRRSESSTKRPQLISVPPGYRPSAGC